MVDDNIISVVSLIKLLCYTNYLHSTLSSVLAELIVTGVGFLPPKHHLTGYVHVVVRDVLLFLRLLNYEAAGCSRQAISWVDVRGGGRAGSGSSSRAAVGCVVSTLTSTASTHGLCNFIME